MPLADELLAVLNNPTHMWAHALRQLSVDSQRLFLTLPLLPQAISTDDLQVAYTKQQFERSEPFLDSLRALEDSFISIDAWHNMRWVEFRNPSLEDFSHAYIDRNSDWLDRLLSNPVYYEQISNIYKLAMSRAVLVDVGQLSADAAQVIPLPPPFTSKVFPGFMSDDSSGPRQYEGINSWVTGRHEQLIAQLVSLARSAPSVKESIMHDRSDPNTRLKEIVEIIAVFGKPSEATTKDAVTSLIDGSLQADSQRSAEAMVELLQNDHTRAIIDSYSTGNPVEALRYNILDKDTWKFAVLATIDEWLEIDAEEAMGIWGSEYVDYANQLVDELMDSDDLDDIRAAITEIEEVSAFLEFDLNDSLDALQQHLDSLPPERNDDDYEDYETISSSRDSSSVETSSQELDNMFSSLLD